VRKSKKEEAKERKVREEREMEGEGKEEGRKD
jgi:hypothetical protein